MLKFPGQFHSFRKTTSGDNLITFSVDRLYTEDVVEIVNKEIGTEFVVYLEDVTNETNLNEDHKELMERFRNKLHALLANLAKLKEKTPAEVKDKLRPILIQKDLMVSSTSELGVKGYAVACNIVERWIKEHGDKK